MGQRCCVLLCVDRGDVCYPCDVEVGEYHVRPGSVRSLEGSLIEKLQDRLTNPLNITIARKILMLVP